MIPLLQKIGFQYESKPRNAKKGLAIPQLVRKIGAIVTGLETKQEIKENIVKISKNLGQEFELALLFAFFLDEGGMSKAKTKSSEITIHQESDLEFLEKIGGLLNRFNIKWAKNKKGWGWVIRIKAEGVVKFGELLLSLKKQDISLLHREPVFQTKVAIAKKTGYKTALRSEVTAIKKHLLENDHNKTITLEYVKSLFKSNFNVSSRSQKLVCDMRKRKELKRIGLAKYLVTN